MGVLPPVVSFSALANLPDSPKKGSPNIGVIIVKINAAIIKIAVSQIMTEPFEIWL